MNADETAATVHASCVCVGGPDGLAGLLIVGASGSGKSSLALDLISRGARLVADDRTALRRVGGEVRAAAPATLAGMIEARGVGLLRVPCAPETTLVAVADLDAAEPERLPPPRTRRLLGVDLPRILCADNPARAPALIALLRSGGARETP